MKILLHGNAPWVPTGYGQQMGIFAPRIASLGYEVVISSFFGLQGAPLVWNDLLVLPASLHHHGSDILNERMKREKADVLLTLMDIWVLEPKPLSEIPHVYHWMPVDCSPLSMMDVLCLRASGAGPIAMSQFGVEQLRDAAFNPMFVPHGIDTSVFKPGADREALREEMGLAGKFVIGMNAANKDAVRKGMYEQFAAFAKFHEKHPDSHMLVHGLINDPQGLDLGAILRGLGITNAVNFVDQYVYLTGSMQSEHVAGWCQVLDLYSGCSYGEGFGLPSLEAQACGVPVVLTNASAMREMCGGGWLVDGEPFWNPVHQARWVKPSVEGILRVYEEAYERGPVYEAHQKNARAFALQFDADRVLNEYWKPVLERIEASL